VTTSADRVRGGLSPARDARAIQTGERIHVVGAAGAGASAAALLAERAGAIVTACDAGGASPYTAALDARGIVVAVGHDPAHVTNRPAPQRLAVTRALTAVEPDHPELVAARSRGIPLEAWQQVVADAAVDRTLVAVAGTHGKSTTAGWLVHVLAEAGADPSAFVGALLPSRLTGGPPATARWGRGAAFVVEADEYAGNFDPYRPDVAILTSAEWDHPDVFADEGAVLDAFAAWIRAGQGNDGGQESDGQRPALVANVGRPGVRGVLERLGPAVATVLPVALVDDAGDLEAQAAVTAERYGWRHGTALVGAVVDAHPKATVVHIAGLPAGTAEVTLRVPGRHNAEDAMAVAGAALLLGLDDREITAGLEAFAGAARRLELKGEAGGVAVLDDYGHHPTAIGATLEAARQRYPGRRLWAVFEPLTYYRTAAMLESFADALALADRVAVADIWAGRDPDTTVVSPGALADAVNRRRPSMAAATGSVEQTAHHVAEEARAGDVVVVMGGGRSYRIAELLLERLRAARSLH